jgi:hypothetical protein
MANFELSMEGIAEWCKRKGVPHRVADNGQIHIPHPANANWVIRVIARQDRNMVSFGLVVPYPIPEDRYEELNKTISYLNSRTFMGAWVLNHGSNSLYFRITLPGGDTIYSDEGLLFVMQVIFGTSNASGEVIRKVVKDGATYELAMPKEGT